jgi:hypothetical protein
VLSSELTHRRNECMVGREQTLPIILHTFVVSTRVVQHDVTVSSRAYPLTEPLTVVTRVDDEYADVILEGGHVKHSIVEMCGRRRHCQLMVNALTVTDEMDAADCLRGPTRLHTACAHHGRAWALVAPSQPLSISPPSLSPAVASPHRWSACPDR